MNAGRNAAADMLKGADRRAQVAGVEISLPLPQDVDVSDMPHMPLFDQRLVRSNAWRRAKHWRGDGPGLGYCLFNLWSYAFRSVPAGSIADDDEELADAARCDIEHWRAMKPKALTGWQLIGHRWHHPVVSEIAWKLWLTRIESKHEAAMRAWRAVVKRKTDAGVAPPDPPGEFENWLARSFPATADYRERLAREDLCVTVSGDDMTVTTYIYEGPEGEGDGDVTGIVPPRDGHRGENDGYKRPKLSEGKNIYPPKSPRAVLEDVTARGLGNDAEKIENAGKIWFRGELERLKREFGPMLNLIFAYLKKPGVPGDYLLVNVFRDAWLDPGGQGRDPAIVMPTKPRSDALKAEHGAWIEASWPSLKIRWATIEELRARRAAKAVRA